MLKYFSAGMAVALFIAGTYFMSYTLTPGYTLSCT